MAQNHENAQAELVTQAYQSACQGLRLGVVSIKDFGESMLKAQKALKMDDQRLYAWVRKITGCKKSDATLNNWKRLAKFWTEKVEPKFKAAENAGKVFTLQDALALIKGKSRPGRQKKVKTQADPNPTTSSLAEGKTDAKPQEGQEGVPEEPIKVRLPFDQPKKDRLDAKPQESQEGETEEPIKVRPPFDQPEKDRLAAVYAQNGPAPTSIQRMTMFVIPNLKKVAEVGVSDMEVPFLANAIDEALALIEALKAKYAIS